jgi:hypothetical protein
LVEHDKWLRSISFGCLFIKIIVELGDWIDQIGNLALTLYYVTENYDCFGVAFTALEPTAHA